MLSSDGALRLVELPPVEDDREVELELELEERELALRRLLPPPKRLLKKFPVLRPAELTVFPTR